MYLKHWNLSRKPFASAFEPEMVLFRGGFAEVYRSLSLAARLEPRVFWLTGLRGSGKSTLLRSLKVGLADETGFTLLSGRYITDETRLYESIGAPPSHLPPGAGLAARLEAMFVHGDWGGKPGVFAVDDADEIDDGRVLRELLSLYDLFKDGILPLTLIYAGDSVPAALEPTPTRPAERLSLPEPDDEMLVEIATHRLGVAGSAERIFTRPALVAAATEAGGDIGRMMTVCDLCLQIGFENGMRRIDANMVLQKVQPFVRKFFAKEEERRRAAASGRSAVIDLADAGRHLRVIETIRRESPPPPPAPAPEPRREKQETPAKEPPAGEPPAEEPSAEEAPPPVEEQIAAAEAEEAAGAEETPEAEAPEAAAEEEPPGSLFFSTGLETYRREYVGEAVEEEETPEALNKPIAVEESPQAQGPVTTEMLYTFAIWLMKDVLRRLRRLEFVRLDPVRELSATFVARLKDDLKLLRNVLQEEEQYNLETHLVNVAVLAIATGHRLDLPHEDLLLLGEATLMHDIGHLHCGEELLQSEDRFDRLDFKTIKQHPQVGHDLIMRKTDGGEQIAKIILQEHERDDGLGYPNYLVAAEIHPFARIIGICDFFEALTHSRAHRKAKPPAEAITELRESRTRRSERRLIAALSSAVLDAIGHRSRY